MTKESQQREIERVKDQIVKNYKPEKIILFGSFAYGKPKSNSDVDLLVIKKTNKKKVERIKELLMKVESSLPLEPLVYNPAEYRERLDLGDFFFKTIFAKGKILYEK